MYFSLFWPVARVFPRYAAPLLLLPAPVLLGRLVLGAHYLSDVWAAVWLVVALTELFWWALKLRVARLRASR